MQKEPAIRVTRIGAVSMVIYGSRWTANEPCRVFGKSTVPRDSATYFPCVDNKNRTGDLIPLGVMFHFRVAVFETGQK